MSQGSMNTTNSGTESPSNWTDSGTSAPRVPAEIAELHSRCGIYTRAEAVDWFLNEVGWVQEIDLRKAKLLDPAAGDGAFLVEAARRLCRSFRSHGQQWSYGVLEDRITAYEIHPGEAAIARCKVIEVLCRYGIEEGTASRLAAKWIRTNDFLIADMGAISFTHIVGNPPYVRWSHLPNRLRNIYEASLPNYMAKGDLCLAFLGRCLGLLAQDGRLGFLCADRWLYAAYAEEFRAVIKPSFHIEKRCSVNSRDVFQTSVSAYPIKLIVSRTRSRRPVSNTCARTKAVQEYELLRDSHLTLKEAGMEVRVGPALGVECAFTGTRSDLNIEGELLQPYVKPKELAETTIQWSGKFVICMHDKEGALRDLADFPLLRIHLERYRKNLEKRSIVVNGAPWYRPIDRVLASTWRRPKLLLPEMTAYPRAILDTQGFIPSHGIYAVFDPDDDLDRLRSAIDSESLRITLRAFSPWLSGDTFRCYKKFIDIVPFGAR